MTCQTIVKQTQINAFRYIKHFLSIEFTFVPFVRVIKDKFFVYPNFTKQRFSRRFNLITFSQKDDDFSASLKFNYCINVLYSVALTLNYHAWANEYSEMAVPRGGGGGGGGGVNELKFK